jgi:predicted dienelactone hydrolase
MSTISNTSFLATLNSTTVRYIKRNKFLPLLARAAMRTASVIAPRFAVKQALEKFLTPPRYARPAAEQRLLESASPFFVETPHGRIAAWRFGKVQDPVVLMSHGWGGRGAQFRYFVQPLLAANYQVVLFDHLGHGMSGGTDSSLVMFWRGRTGTARSRR